MAADAGIRIVLPVDLKRVLNRMLHTLRLHHCVATAPYDKQPLQMPHA